MGRWSHDGDDYRLPEGMKRVGYDADEERFYFLDTDGTYWRGAPGERLGKMTKVFQSGPSCPDSSQALWHGRPGLQLPLVTDCIGDPAEVQLRPQKDLPQIPGRRSPGNKNTFSRRISSDQHMDGGSRTSYEEGPQIKTQAEAPMPGSQRQTIWTTTLDPDQPDDRPQTELAEETFVLLEPAETMTKAFPLHGLLSDGMEDKEDRSAMGQEELSCESGASLINVPNDPPPPQSGLLGDVEGERERDGELGAVLTERESEKRISEERLRRLDEQQRRQLNMQQAMMFNPMMNQMMMNMMMNMNSMMTGGGLPPMMTGGMGGMNFMTTGGGMYLMISAQHMFAAQQAALAYQQAITTFAVAGSQVGGIGAGAEGSGPSSQGGNNLNIGSPRMGGMLNRDVGQYGI